MPPSMAASNGAARQCPAGSGHNHRRRPRPVRPWRHRPANSASSPNRHSLRRHRSFRRHHENCRRTAQAFPMCRCAGIEDCRQRPVRRQHRWAARRRTQARCARSQRTRDRKLPVRSPSAAPFRGPESAAAALLARNPAPKVATSINAMCQRSQKRWTNVCRNSRRCASMMRNRSQLALAGRGDGSPWAMTAPACQLAQFVRMHDGRAELADDHAGGFVGDPDGVRQAGTRSKHAPRASRSPCHLRRSRRRLRVTVRESSARRLRKRGSFPPPRA